MDMLDWFFFVLSDLRLGEYRRVLKTLSHVDGLTPGSAKSADTSYVLEFVFDLLSMLRTWSKMGSRVCRVVDGPWSGICSVAPMLLLLLLLWRGAWTARGEC